MKIIACKQGTPEWFTARRGVVTASEIDSLVTPLWKARTGDGVETYRFLKLAEKLIGYAPPDVGTHAMVQGQLVESIARPWYEFTYGVKVETPGFCASDDGRIGCSPDGLIGDDCGLELKCPQPPTHLKYLIGGCVPPHYLAQVHFSMLVTGRPRWIFASYSRQFPALVVEVNRDESIQQILKDALHQFFKGFDAIYTKMKAEADAENAAKTADYYRREGITPP